MNKSVFLFVLGSLSRVLAASFNSEVLWVKDVTPFRTHKRTLSDLDFPDRLIFQLRRGENVLTLNLKRNDMIDPNSDVYFVKQLKDGRSILEKAPNLRNEDVAYYQDIDNEASIAVKCVRRSSKWCDRILNGKIRMGDETYNLQPLETNLTPRTVLEAPDNSGREYVLQIQARTQKEMLVENEEMPSTEKRNNPRTVYDVEVLVLIDWKIWRTYSSFQRIAENRINQDATTRKIREYFSHIINGVNLRYQAIEDKTLSINIFLRGFVIFKEIRDFPHKRSKVIIRNGRTMIEVDDYLDDVIDWDVNNGSVALPPYDHAMLFTRHDLYEETPDDADVTGRSTTGEICTVGERTSIVEDHDYFLTVTTAAHELGHSLGSSHDGFETSRNCSAYDYFIMCPVPPKFDPAKKYSRKHWLFSSCSVEAFKKTLKDKGCVTNEGVMYNLTEWNMYVQKKPGEVYTPSQQCEFIRGHRSVYCGTEPGKICHFMKCTDPKTGICMGNYSSAATGTGCGANKWCIEGRCVSKEVNNAHLSSYTFQDFSFEPIVIADSDVERLRKEAYWIHRLNTVYPKGLNSKTLYDIH